MNKIDFTKLLSIEPYSLKKAEKTKLYKEELNALTLYHYNNCEEYKKILDNFSYKINEQIDLENLPYLPIRLFKYFELKSVKEEEIVKIMTSSGTSGQALSKIFLDKENISNQTQILTHILSSYLGEERLPLLFFDTEIVKKDRTLFSARGAGIVGFTPYGKKAVYALNEDMKPNFEKIEDFCEKYKDEKVLIFGYTSIIWQHIVKECEKKNKKFNFNNAILFHIGGWKKLKEQAVDSVQYNSKIKEIFGNIAIYNYYGMAEQLGSVFVECEYGHMHCSNYSNILIRRAKDFSLCEQGEKGIIQLISLLPSSYPGHSILTEDEGIILGEDDCKCQRKGKYFKIIGRLKQAEIRGCSDSYEQR